MDRSESYVPAVGGLHCARGELIRIVSVRALSKGSDAARRMGRAQRTANLLRLLGRGKDFQDFSSTATLIGDFDLFWFGTRRN
jgi:hypothetical protein